VLDLCRRIIESGRAVLKTEYEMVYFPGDDLFAATRPRGLPIGNMTSQFWANVYLNGLDHFVGSFGVRMRAGGLHSEVLLARAHPGSERRLPLSGA
jgi:hypothetical protein